MRIRTGSLVALLALGCAQSVEQEATLRVDDISATNLVVGETVDFYGHGFLQGADGTTRLRFAGRFTSADGSVDDVRFAISPTHVGHIEDGDGDDPTTNTQIVTWTRFGPFANPFTGTPTYGTFQGSITPEVTDAEGTITTGQPLELELKVAPHLVLEAFEPIDATCGAPAMRALPGVPYELGVRAVGIKATRFVYQVSNVNGQRDVVTFEHDFGRGNPVATDLLGRDEPLVFNPIGPALQSYLSPIRVIAYDDDGNSVETALPMSIHRPMEVVYGGEYELAQLYEPVPVSGCTPGAIGTVVEYAESETETRQQSVAVTVSNKWLRQEGRSMSQSTHEGIASGESRSRSIGGAEWEGETTERGFGVTYSQDETTRIGYASSNGEEWSWNMSEGETDEDYRSRMNELFGEGSLSTTVGASGSGSVPGFAKVTGSVEATVGVTAGARTRGTSGNRNARTNSRGWGMSGSSNESRSFGSTTSEGRSESLTGNFALSNSRQRSYNDTETRDMSRTWDVSTGHVDDQSVTVGTSEAEESTWTNSESVTVGQSLSGVIPNGRAGQFYRQTSRWVRRAEVRAYDMCGLATHLGELQFNEWTWAADLAVGDECSGTPIPSQLPKARCVIGPCD